MIAEESKRKRWEQSVIIPHMKNKRNKKKSQFKITNKQTNKKLKEKLLPKIKLFFQIEEKKKFCKTVFIVLNYQRNKKYDKDKRNEFL